MNLSKNQIKLFRRLHRNYKVSLEFLAANFNKIINLYNYAISHFIVIRQKLRLRKNRAFIIYNHLRNQFKAKRIKKRSWTKHFKLHRKKLRAIHKLQYETVEDEIDQHGNSENPILDDKIGADENIEVVISEEQDVHILSPEKVQQKLYEQLDILKSGKRNISLLGSDSTEKNQQSSTNYSAENSHRNAPNQLKENLISNNILERKWYLPKDYSISNIIQKNITTDKEEENVTTKEISMIKRSGNFLDSRIKKLQCNKNITVSSASSEFDVPCSSISMRRVSVSTSPPAEKQPLDEETFSNSSSFHGFTELDIDAGRIPGMIPIPIVNRTLGEAQNSAFVIENLEKILNDCTNVEIPKRRNIEEKLYMPEMSKENRRPITFVEKPAILLHKRSSIKQYMLNDAHTISSELQRRTQPLYEPNFDIIKNVQNSAAPAKRKCWKTSAQYSTEKGRFFLQIANIDNIEYKIPGTRGNNNSIFLPKQNSMVSLKKVQSTNCPPQCYRFIEDFKRVRIINSIKKELPKIEFKEFPKIDKSLKMLSDKKSHAVSTLVTKTNNKKKMENTSLKSVICKTPFVNNEDRVRKIFKRQEQFDEALHFENFEFCKNIDKSNSNEVACTNMITDMIKTVSLGINENCLIKQDPDINYTEIDKINAMTIETKHNIKQAATKKRKRGRQKLVSKLKRLNATVIDADRFDGKGNTDIKECKEHHCRLGCVCQSLKGRPIVRKHCGKLECIFECCCKQNPLLGTKDLNTIISDEDALFLRKKATARKAPQRYDEYAVQEEDINNNQSDAICHSQGGTLNKEYMEKRKPLYIFSDEKTIDKFKHCSVALNRLRGFENVQPWCMIHCLYKCFCKNKATCRIPFEMEKVDYIVADDSVIHSRKRTYSFPKDNDKSLVKKQHKFGGINDHKVQDRSTDMKQEKVISTKEKYNSCLQYGSRSTPIPQRYKNNKHKEALESKVLKSDNSCKSLVVQAEDPRKSKNIADKTIADSNEVSIGSIHNNTPNNINDTDTTAPNLDIPKIPINTTVCSLNIAQMVTSPILNSITDNKKPCSLSVATTTLMNTENSSTSFKAQLPPSNIVIQKFNTNTVDDDSLIVREEEADKKDGSVTFERFPDIMSANLYPKELDITPTSSLPDELLASPSHQLVDPFNGSILVENQRNSVIKPTESDSVPSLQDWKLTNSKDHSRPQLAASGIFSVSSGTKIQNKGSINPVTVRAKPLLKRRVTEYFAAPTNKYPLPSILSSLEMNSLNLNFPPHSTKETSLENSDYDKNTNVCDDDCIIIEEEEAGKKDDNLSFEGFRNILVNSYPIELDITPTSSLPDELLASPSHQPVDPFNGNQRNSVIKLTGSDTVPLLHDWKLSNSKDHSRPQLAASGIFFGPTKIQNKGYINPVTVRAKSILKRRMTEYSAAPRNKYPSIPSLEMNSLNLSYDKNTNASNDDDDCIIIEEEEAGQKDGGVSFEGFRNISAIPYPKELTITPSSSSPDELLASQAHQPVDPFNGSVLERNNVINPTVPLLQGRILTNAQYHSKPRIAAPEMNILNSNLPYQNANEIAPNNSDYYDKPILIRRVTEYFTLPPKNSNSEMNLNASLTAQTVNKAVPKQLLIIKPNLLFKTQD